MEALCYGWEGVFIISKVFTSGVASSLLGGKHVKRTRHGYHLTLAWLHILEYQAYVDYRQSYSYGPFEPMDVWETRLVNNCLTFRYWITVKNFLLLVCLLVRGQRHGDWILCLNACYELCSWFFSCSRCNYSRWTLVFLRDMVRLPVTHPDVHAAFMKGLFVIQRSAKKFSLMALDQS